MGIRLEQRNRRGCALRGAHGAPRVESAADRPVLRRRHRARDGGQRQSFLGTVGIRMQESVGVGMTWLMEDGANRTGFDHLTGRLTRFCVDHEFPLWLAGGQILRGPALAAHGRIDEGRAITKEGLDTWGAAGTLLTVPHALAVAGWLEARGGRIGDALGRLEVALETAQKTGECWYEPELHRLRGDLEWSGGKGLRPDPVAAEASFAHRLHCAQIERLFTDQQFSYWFAHRYAGVDEAAPAHHGSDTIPSL